MRKDQAEWRLYEKAQVDGTWRPFESEQEFKEAKGWNVIIRRIGIEAPKAEWPERLTLRDTKVFADEGQRIYTTATGYGYEKREYVRADVAAPVPAQAVVTDEMVELVAKAICEASSAEWRTGTYLGFEDADNLNNHWRFKAKAVLAALSYSNPTGDKSCNT